MSADRGELVFLDTSILVYALTVGPDPRHGQARKLFQDLVRQERFCLSTQILQELYVTLTRKQGLTSAAALSVLEDLAEYPVFQVDKTAILDAVRLASSAHLPFWDALVLTAARRLGANAVLTEALNHGQFIGSVLIRNPFREV